MMITLSKPLPERILSLALAQVDDASLYAELGRRRAALRSTNGGGRPKKLRPCPTCGQQLGTREQAAHKCPAA